MWVKYKYFIISGFIFIAIGVLETMKPKETMWVESYSKFDKIPYGDYVLYESLDQLFTQPIRTNSESLSQLLKDSLSNTNLIIINNFFEAERGEINKLLEFVNQGNQALIISRVVSDQLLDTLGLSTKMEIGNGLESDVKYRLANDSIFYKGPTFNILFRTYFDSLSMAKPLGYRSDSLVNFVEMDFGKGKIFIHVLPSAFTNAFMLTGENNQYISKVLSVLPDQPTIWDEYYKARKQYIHQTPLQQILTTDGMRQALYLALFGALVYMIFASKRRQRIIPVLPTKENSTVEFVETMGQLYYNESNHKDIGVKRVNYFLSDIRERHRIETTELDEIFAHKLSTLSGVPREDVDRLITNFRVITTVSVVLNERIVEQDKLIENFYKIESAYGK